MVCGLAGSAVAVTLSFFGCCHHWKLARCYHHICLRLVPPRVLMFRDSVTA